LQTVKSRLGQSDPGAGLALTLSAGGIGRWQWDVVADRVTADPSLARMFGVSRQKAKGAPLACYLPAIHPADRANVEQQIDISLRAGAVYQAEYRVVQRDGAVTWVLARGRVERDANKQPRRLHGVVLNITARVLAEQERDVLTAVVAQQARIFNTTLSSIVDFAYIFDKDGRFLYANQALLDLWAITLEDAVGKNFVELRYPEELAAKLQRQIQHVFDSGEVVRDETPYTSPSGAAGFYEYIFTPVHKDDQTIDVVAGSTRDITARKAAETEREQGLARERFLGRLDEALRPLIDPDAIAHTATALIGHHLQVNRCIYARVEDNPAAFVLTSSYSEGVQAMLDHQTFQQFGAECLRLAKAGEPFAIQDIATDARINEADREAYTRMGTRALICVPVLHTGRVVAAMMVHVDVTRAWRQHDVQLLRQVAIRCWESVDRSLARADAELQKRLLYSQFMQAPTLIAVLRGPSHVIELANPLVCRIWGRSSEELKGRPLFDAMPELRDQVFKTLLENAFHTGVPYVGTETPAQLGRGTGHVETVYFDFVYSPYRDIQGQIEGVFVIASDVTQQVVARQQLDQLRQVAEAANRNKDEFLATLGHELRNPLSAILTAVAVMKMRGNGETAREQLVIERQTNHLARLVDDIVDLSRIDCGKVELRNETLEIAEIVERAVEATGPLLEERGHHLVVNVPSQGLPVDGDPTRLTQVVTNLLTNAARYTNAGGHISVSARADDAEVVLSVQDNGIGISRQALPSIFDLFVQARQPGDRARGGLGLGLTIVRSLVERHGGSVSATSDGAHCGSEFTVRLPLKALPLVGIC
jgi:PAS domain S-box-containing protein